MPRLNLNNSFGPFFSKKLTYERAIFSILFIGRNNHNEAVGSNCRNIRRRFFANTYDYSINEMPANSYPDLD